MTKTTITGNIQDVTGVPATSGTVRFTLRPASSGIVYRVPGTNVVAPHTATCNINSSGQVVGIGGGACQIWGNDVLEPASSAYDVEYAPDGIVSSVSLNQRITGPSYDLSQPVFNSNVNIVPEFQTITTAPIDANLVPAAPGQFNLGDSGHAYGQAWINTLNVASLGNATNINNTIYPATGLPFDVALNAAIAQASSNSIVDATNLTGPQTITSVVTINKSLRVLLGRYSITFNNVPGPAGFLITSCGASLEGNMNGGTVFKPGPSYTGTFVTVQAGSCLNQFQYNYSVRLRDFLIIDGNDANDGTGRTASADGILIRDTDGVEVSNVSVRKLKGTSLRLRNVRESNFYNFYSFAGGDPTASPSKPAVWLGNDISETAIDDCNDDNFYGLRVVYPYERGVLLATANAASLTTGQVVRGINFYGCQFEGRSVDLKGAGCLFGANPGGCPSPFNLVELPAAGTATQAPVNQITFTSCLVSNQNISGGFAGIYVGSGSLGSVIQEVTIIDLKCGGFSDQTSSHGSGSAVVADYIETLEIIGGLYFTNDANVASLNVTANAVRVYIDPATRFLTTLGSANGSGITGTISTITGIVPSTGAYVNSFETFQYASQNVAFLGWVGNPASAVVNLKVASGPAGASIISTDSFATNFMALRSKAGSGGGTVAVDVDQFNVGHNFAVTNPTGDVFFRRMAASAGTLVVGGPAGGPWGNFNLSGWGANAAVDVVSQSRDTRGTVIITTNVADTPSFNPTITLTFADGPFSTAPFAQVTWDSSSSGQIAELSTNTSTTQLVIRYNGTPAPTSALTYRFTYLVIQ